MLIAYGFKLHNNHTFCNITLRIVYHKHHEKTRRSRRTIPLLRINTCRKYNIEWLKLHNHFVAAANFYFNGVG